MFKSLRKTTLAAMVGLMALGPMAQKAQAQDMLDVIGGAVVGGVIGGAIGGKDGARAGAAIGGIGGYIDGADRDDYWD